MLDACNLVLAHRALSAPTDFGLGMPCNVIVREDAGAHITVGFMAR
ncbi:MAG: DUF302 domain-containing protein [Burkholderiaceae bacterium]